MAHEYDVKAGAKRPWRVAKSHVSLQSFWRTCSWALYNWRPWSVFQWSQNFRSAVRDL